MSSNLKRKDPPTPEELEEDANKELKQSSEDESDGTTSRAVLNTLPVVGENLSLIDILREPLSFNPSVAKSFRVQVSNPNSPAPELQEEESEESSSESEPRDTTKMLTMQLCDCDEHIDNTMQKYESVLVIPYSEIRVSSAKEFFIYRAVQFDGFCRKQHRLAIVFPDSFLLKMFHQFPTTDHICRSAVYLKTRSHENRWETCYSGSFSYDPSLRKDRSCAAELYSSPKPYVATHQQSFRIFTTRRKRYFDIDPHPAINTRIKASFTISTIPSKRQQRDHTGTIQLQLPSPEPADIKGVPHKFLVIDRSSTILKLKHPEPALAMKHHLIRHAYLCKNDDYLHCFVALLPDKSFSDYSWQIEPEQVAREELQDQRHYDLPPDDAENWTWKLTVLIEDKTENKDPETNEEKTVKKKSILEPETQSEESDSSMEADDMESLKTKVVLDLTFSERNVTPRT